MIKDPVENLAIIQLNVDAHQYFECAINDEDKRAELDDDGEPCTFVLISMF